MPSSLWALPLRDVLPDELVPAPADDRDARPFLLLLLLLVEHFLQVDWLGDAARVVLPVGLHDAVELPVEGLYLLQEGHVALLQLLPAPSGRFVLLRLPILA